LFVGRVGIRLFARAKKVILGKMKNQEIGGIKKGRFVSGPVRPASGQKKFERADIVFHGVDQSGPSFEVRVFLNNPGADTDTPLTTEHGYVGSFHVYGYGRWPADIGKNPQTLADEADSVIRAPMERAIVATESIRAALAKGEDMTVTVVPVFPGDRPRDAGKAFKFENISIVTR
jgi:hypothetical protein